VIVAVDPGKMSGVAYFRPDAIGLPDAFFSWQTDTWAAVRWIERYLEFTRVEAVICEDYVITHETLKKTRGENWSLESIGALRYVSFKAEVPFTTYTAGESKRFSTDSKLERAGLWNPTAGGHANDAARLIMLHLAKTRRLDLVLSGKFSGGGNSSSSPD